MGEKRSFLLKMLSINAKERASKLSAHDHVQPLKKKMPVFLIGYFLSLRRRDRSWLFESYVWIVGWMKGSP
jgi:hypothetical protein